MQVVCNAPRKKDRWSASAHSEAEKHPNNKGDLKCDFQTNNLFSFTCGLSIEIALNRKVQQKKNAIYCHPFSSLELIMILTNKPPCQQGETTALSAQLPFTWPGHSPAINQPSQDRGTKLTDGGGFQLYQFAPWMLNQRNFKTEMNYCSLVPVLRGHTLKYLQAIWRAQVCGQGIDA